MIFQPKIRLYRIHLLKTINYYQEFLTEKFGPIALSEAHRVVMSRELDNEQSRMRQTEKTTSWQIPLRLTFKDDGIYQVATINEDNLLFVDDV